MDGLMRFPKAPVAVPRLGGSPPITSGSHTGYPWVDGDILYAADLNAAIAAVTVSVLELGARGDGITDDTAALQNALNTFAGKGTVYVPNTGTPYMCSRLAIPTGTDLLIHGTIMQKPGQATALIDIINVSNVTIRGYGIIDGNRANQTTDGACCIASVGASNLQIEGVTVQNAWNWNINITSTTDCRIDRVTMIGGGASNEFADGCDNCWISNSSISGPPNDGAWTFYGGVTNSGITGCIVKNAFASGIGVYADVPQPAPCANIVIADNIVFHNNTGGIAIGTDVTTNVSHTGITITGNRCYANNNIGNNLYADMWINYASGVTISGNDMSGSGSGSNATYGVFVGVHASSVNITGNTIWNEGQGGTAGGGVYIQAANNVLVEGNIFYDTQTPQTMANAILGNAGASNSIIGNLFSRMSGTPITLAPAVDTIIDTNAPAVLINGGGNVSGHIEIISPDTAAALHIEASGAGILNNSHGISYNNGNAIAFQDPGTGTISIQVDGAAFGNVLTDNYAAGTVITLNGIQFATGTSLINAADDAAAAGLGVAVNKVYRNGSVLQVRVS